MYGVGCILEKMFTRATGQKVGGWAGWLWTFGWLLGWGNILSDSYGRAGFIGAKFSPEGSMPSEIIQSYIYGHR